jgi:hypothetical protein
MTMLNGWSALWGVHNLEILGTTYGIKNITWQFLLILNYSKNHI